jgi:hypothetical protein
MAGRGRADAERTLAPHGLAAPRSPVYSLGAKAASARDAGEPRQLR